MRCAGSEPGWRVILFTTARDFEGLQLVSREATWLLASRRDVYSQTGEDGVLEQILEVLPSCDGWCVEFGAWDGLHLSNTRNLIYHHGYSAVLIESDGARYAQLERNYARQQNVVTLNASVGWHDNDNLDRLLAATPIPRDFDFLSIDVDGTDFHVWKAVRDYRPKVVCVEFNPTIPTEIRFVQWADPSVHQGSSLLSLTELAKSKHYELVSVLDFNAFFVDSEYYPLFDIQDNEPATLRSSLEHVTYLFTGYDGTVHLHGCGKLPWHGLTMSESRMQHLPRLLRKHPGTYTYVERGLFAMWLLLASPREFLQRVQSKERRGRR